MKKKLIFYMFAGISISNSALADMTLNKVCRASSEEFYFYGIGTLNGMTSDSTKGFVRDSSGQTATVTYTYVPWVCEEASFFINQKAFNLRTCISDFKDGSLQSQLLIDEKPTPVLCRPQK